MVSQADFLSLINTAGSVYQAYSTGDTNAKVNATKQVASMALSCIWNAVSKVDSAKSETDKNDKVAKNLEVESEKIKNNTTQNLKPIIESIEANIANVEKLLKQLEKV